MNTPAPRGRRHPILLLAVAALAPVFAVPSLVDAQTCTDYVKADVVALDQPWFWNRLGAAQPQGMIYALRRDVVPINPIGGLTPGNVRLRPDRRPRPLVLRMNVGDCLVVHFQNLLAPSPVHDEQPVTRTAGVHIAGLALGEGGILNDGSIVGKNPPSLVSPGGTWEYIYYAQREGAHLMYSTAANTGGEGNGGSLNAGLFGAVHVEPKGAEWYRSQVTEDDLRLARACNTNPSIPCITTTGQPILDYNAVYPPGHRFAGLPILRMTKAGEIVHGDLTAVITGPNHGRFPPGTYRPNPVEPDREQPFREFTIIYHDEIGAVQAFPEFFDQGPLKFTLHSVRDAFAFNYGTGGIGAEILANRLGVGPMHACTECMYEEFFLTSWAVSDPAMVVDIPANTRDQNGNLITGPKATKAFYPDDPSNVYHSYLRDHVKFRLLHGGSKEHHIHHLHAHQWLRTPDSDNSTYLDSQALGPGSGFTLEITHNGGGNRNQTPGDSIFHCHFYPHFAMGMWSLWRVHDTFEAGTLLDAEGRPAVGARALPDGEIKRGTPIPALVPMPTLAMAPVPGAVQIVNGQVVVTNPTGPNPGFPFFVPGVSGHRPPHPPLDTIDDGGLPRHVITAGTFVEHHTPLDFDKELVTADAFQVPELGTVVEKQAMLFHEKPYHPSFTPEGNPANYITNGMPRVAGAPFAEPCKTDAVPPAPTGRPITYKAAAFQFDIKLNKLFWHFKQQRILSLWQDVAPTISGQRAPEPFFFRANTGDCINFYHTNLVPRVYEQDDFQVRTPTDVLGQHIHLVKFDVTASDGAGNGFNYEDGSFSPQEVVDRIAAINLLGGLRVAPGSPTRVVLNVENHPFFGTPGAQTTVQRWYADDVTNNLGKDRTLRTVFTHDHFGPSTHQQVGLYAGLVIEEKNSKWFNQDDGTPLGGREDGGPTSWRANIVPSDPSQSYREFLLEFADFQHAYWPDGTPVNPPGRVEVGLPFLLEPPPVATPEAISADDVGTMVVNYRNEPVALRVRNPQTNTQAAGDAGDLSKSFSSTVTRADPLLNVQPTFYPPLTPGVQPKDPYTPLLRAFENDKVQVRILVGATEEGHNFSVNGQNWLFEPSDPNSGFRNSQMMGISEHYEFVLPPLLPESSLASADYLYQPGAAVDDTWNGLWGLFRVYSLTAVPVPEPEPGPCQPCPVGQICTDICLPPTALATPEAELPHPLPNNPRRQFEFTEGPKLAATLDEGAGATDREAPAAPLAGEEAIVGPPPGVCPSTAPIRQFKVAAVAASQALPGGRLVYNERTSFGGPLVDPTAILYVRETDLDLSGKLLATVPIEPLVLRAAAGDCIGFTLTNRLPSPSPAPIDLDGFNTMPMIVNKFNANQVKPSQRVGLHAQLVHYDVANSDGFDVGFNPVQTLAPGETKTYWWYAGQSFISGTTQVFKPVEFGGLNLVSSDPIKHSNKGAIGALIIEPQGSSWTEDTKSRASATVTTGNASGFRDFALLYQSDVNMRNDNGPIPNLFDAEDPEDSGQKALNYRSEPIWKRLGFPPNSPLTGPCTNVPKPTRCFDYTKVLSNDIVGGDPVTPVFTAAAGKEARFRVLEPGGHARNQTFMLHGHVWLDEPWVDSSTRIGFNPLSEWGGSSYGHGATNHLEVALLPELGGAGGPFHVTGDFLYRTFDSFQFTGGQWGIFRVTP